MKHSVLIVGAGPTGLMLAAELALARVDVAIIERRPNQEVAGSRAGGLHARALELLDQRGIAQRFLDEGKPVQAASFASHVIDISDLPTRHNYVLALWQSHIERLLAARVDELGVEIYRGDFASFTQTETVKVTLSEDRTFEADYLVACDGGRSAIRKQAGIEFPGSEASVSYLIAECEMTNPALGMRRTAKGVAGIGPLDPQRVRVVLAEAEVNHGDQPSIDELRAALAGLYGTDFDVRAVTWLSRFTDATRHASAYRAGRVLLAGDAAHIHSPAGGQGLNMGLYDAVNLGWKLAQVVHGNSPDSLLDTYQAERHPHTQRLLATTLATTAANRGDAQSSALRDELAEILKMAEPRKRYAAMMSGLDVRYDLGGTHPLVGRRMPDIEINTSHGPERVFSLLHDACPIVIDFGSLDPARIGFARYQEARYFGPWELPVVGTVPAPKAVLVRPDGHVAWVGDGTDAGLREAVTAWCGVEV